MAEDLSTALDVVLQVVTGVLAQHPKAASAAAGVVGQLDRSIVGGEHGQRWMPHSGSISRVSRTASTSLSRPRSSRPSPAWFCPPFSDDHNHRWASDHHKEIREHRARATAP